MPEDFIVEKAKRHRRLAACAPGELALLNEVCEIGLNLVVRDLVGCAFVVAHQSHHVADVRLVRPRGKSAKDHLADHALAELAHRTPP